MTAGALVEPPRPTPAEVEIELAAHIRALAGPDAVPRPEQLAAVTAVVAGRQRTLLVARTGFGKSGETHSSTLLDVSFDLPVVVEFFDSADKVNTALESISDLIAPGHVLTFAADFS